MQAAWLVQNHSPQLVLFFNGWGMDATPFEHLKSKRFDVLTLYDYREAVLSEPLRERLTLYREIYVIAWSLGVWAANAMKDQLPHPPVFSLACNGTLNPIHARYGIHPGIFQSTLETWSSTVQNQFYKNMFTDVDAARRFALVQPRRTIEDQSMELRSLRERIDLDPDKVAAGRFDSALISEQDQIFPKRAQIRFWEGQSNCHVIQGGHYPFFQWSLWEELLDAVPVASR